MAEVKENSIANQVKLIALKVSEESFSDNLRIEINISKNPLSVKYNVTEYNKVI